jgi:hypothetical protein
MLEDHSYERELKDFVYNDINEKDKIKYLEKELEYYWWTTTIRSLLIIFLLFCCINYSRQIKDLKQKVSDKNNVLT